MPTPEEARRAFERIDTDGSGTLDREEITTVLTQEFGLTLTDDELEVIFLTEILDDFRRFVDEVWLF